MERHLPGPAGKIEGSEEGLRT
uniref:Uncharacterized protein n=1 Tax=Anguilla anguilla TaxID=7936 RepID=A0A0E9U278_ANGAN